MTHTHTHTEILKKEKTYITSKINTMTKENSVDIQQPLQFKWLETRKTKILFHKKQLKIDR